MTNLRRVTQLCSTVAAEVRRDGGGVLAEYGLLLAGVAMVSGIAVAVLGPSISNWS